jgi:hypothetical protein
MAKDYNKPNVDDHNDLRACWGAQPEGPTAAAKEDVAGEFFEVRFLQLNLVPLSWPSRKQARQ